MTSFKRARSAEQRTERRAAILAAAAAMLAEMPVAQVTLNELSRRVGLAKSNVLRYFESREAVLLELLDAEQQAWLNHLRSELAGVGDDLAAAPVRDRGDQVVATIAASLTARPILCDLLSSQAAVLEHNVSPEIAAKYKRAAIASFGVLASLILVHLPELGEVDAQRFAAGASLVAGAVWTHSRPSAAMLAAYEADPALAAMRIDFTATMREVMEILIAGLLARPSQR